MAHTYALGVARTSSTSNPISFSHTVAKGDTVVCLLIKGVGAADRAGGSPTWGSYTFTQADTTRKAGTSPEASAEIWYLLNPFPATATLTIPNTGAITIKYTVGVGRAQAGGFSAFETAIGANANSGTNPTAGNATITQAGDIGFAIVASGAQTWNPSAQSGTAIANTDDGADGGGEQYVLNPAVGTFALTWTFGTSDDWGAVSAYFKEIPPNKLNNYGSVKVPDGMSTGERIR